MEISWFKKQLDSIPEFNNILVAVSGGVDSMVLLHLIAKIDIEQKIKIIHINHNLQSISNKWQNLIKQRCDELKLELIIENITINKTSKQSLEEQARDLRYQKFSQYLQVNDLLLLAHHKNDQAETILFRLMKGAGLKGLGGIKKHSKYKHFFKFCPFLDISKLEILNYAKANNLAWYDDPSNTQDNFDRNFLRNKIIPTLQSRWPGAVEAIVRAGNICQDSLAELQPIIQDNYNNCYNFTSNTISISKLKLLSKFMQAEVIRYWLKNNNYLACSREYLEILFTQVIGAKLDRNPILNCKEFVFRRYQDNLFLLPAKTKSSQNSQVILHIDKEGSLFLSDNSLTIKYTHKGDKAKKIFQEYNIPPWARHKHPAVFKNSNLIAILGVWEDKEFLGTLKHNFPEYYL